VKLR
jgi:DNA-binding sugar fermentation-stimulating protein